MTDYSSLNLNGFLQPENSPVTNAGFVDGYTFNSENERGAVNGYSIRDFAITNAKIGTAAIDNAKIATASISDANIGTLTFDTISGGTATLGGTANGEGVVSVQDSGGTERVRLDNTGLTVYDGNIAMENEGGTTFIDSKGLISSSISNYGTTSSYGTAGLASISGTATSDTGVATVTLNLIRNTNILMLADTNIYYTDGGTSPWNAINHMKIKVDGTTQSDTFYRFKYAGYGDSGDNDLEMGMSCHNFQTLGSGSHTIVLAGSVEVSLGASTVSWRGYRLTAYYIGS